MAIKTTQEK